MSSSSPSASTPSTQAVRHYAKRRSSPPMPARNNCLLPALLLLRTALCRADLRELYLPAHRQDVRQVALSLRRVWPSITVHARGVEHGFVPATRPGSPSPAS